MRDGLEYWGDKAGSKCAGTFLYYSLELISGGYAIGKQAAGTLQTIKEIVKNPNIKMKQIDNIRGVYARVTKPFNGRTVIDYEWKQMDILSRTVYVDFKNRVAHIILIAHDYFQMEMAFFPELSATLGEDTSGNNSEPNTDIPHKKPDIPHKKPKSFKKLF